MISAVKQTIPVLIGLLLLASCEVKPSSKLVSLKGTTMGTTYHIKYVAPPESISSSELQGQVDLLLADLENSMSTYKADSEISKFNQDPKKTSFKFSHDATRVIKEALTIGNASGGALDITIAPLIDLWGFGKKRSSTIPTDQEIAKAKENSGLHLLTLDSGRLKVSNPKVQIDLSSIAKGFAVDEVAALLNMWDFPGYMVEIGGEIKVKGTKLNSQPWMLGIEKPDTIQRSIQISFIAKDIAMATSGDYRNYFESGGKRFSHIIDPNTAKPITHHLASVTVLHKNSITADGWATAFLVLGEKKALKIAKEQSLAVYLIFPEGDHFKVAMTPQFSKIINSEATN